jgi:general secretion pathway protein J
MTRAEARKHGGAARGFVLIELLVALALTGLVAVLLFAGIRLASVGLDRISAQADRLDRQRGIATLLRRELGSALTLPRSITPGMLFVGGPTRLHFLTLAEDGAPDLDRVDLALDTTAQGDRRLVLTRRRADPLVPADFQKSVLAAHVRGFSLAYYGTDPASGKAGWYARWQGMRVPPRLVRVVLDPGSGDAVPPIVIRVWAGPS